jgi:hypothetical protein
VTPRGIVAAGLIVCLVACAAYASTVNAYFLNDDFGVVALLAGKPATYFPRWFVTSWMDTIWGYNPDEIRPFPALSYQLTAFPNAASPVAHHLLNIVIHAANGLLVLALARTAIGLSVQAAAIAALVFVLLPVQAESVAWITGRVDSLPALFYLGSVLAYVRWRQTSPKRPGGREGGPYLVALALGFMALFSKQNTITLAPALLFYDLIVERRWPQLRWSWIWPYLPFTAITLGYLYLRYVLFGEVVRESLLTADGFAYSLQVIERHAWRTIFGHASAPASVEAWIAIALLVVVAFCAVRQGARVGSRLLASAVYFVPVWWLLGIAPVLVAGYDSPRHAYLAAVAWAMLAGVAFQWTWMASKSRIARATVMLVTTAILGWYAVQLSASIGDWNRRALISSRAARDVEREALAAPEGTLLIVGAPASLWEWAVPFVARPPFTSTDLTKRTLIVSPRLLYCCRGQWEADTRWTLAAWQMRDDGPPVVALRWNEATGALMRITDREDPDLRSLASYLAQIPSGDDLDRVMTDALTKLVRR